MGPPGWVMQPSPGFPGYGHIAPPFYVSGSPVPHFSPFGEPNWVVQQPFGPANPDIQETYLQTAVATTLETARHELQLAGQQVEAGQGFGAVSFVTRAFNAVNSVIAWVPEQLRPPEFADVVQASLEEVAKVARAVGAVGFTIGGGMTAGIYFELQFDADGMTRTQGDQGEGDQ